MEIRISTLTILIFLIFSFSQINAQLSIGIQGGLNSAIFHISDKSEDASLSYKNGIILGSLVNYRLNNMFSLQFEPRYTQKGEKVKVIRSFRSEGTAYFNYLEAPIFLVIDFTESNFRPQFFGGVNFGYLLSADVESIVNGKEENYDIKSDYNDIDIAIDFGLGGKLKINKLTEMLVSIRYSFGVYDISDVFDGNTTNRGIQILLGVLYKI